MGLSFSSSFLAEKAAEKLVSGLNRPNLHVEEY